MLFGLLLPGNIVKHRHHVIPRHAGGTNDLSNIVYLTPAEHAEAHRELYRKHGRWQDKLAYEGLSGIIGHEEAVSRMLSEAGKSNKGISRGLGKPKSRAHAMKVGATKRGIPRPDSVRLKISTTRKLRGVPAWTEEHRANFVKAVSKPKSPETKTKMSLARKLYWERQRGNHETL